MYHTGIFGILNKCKSTVCVIIIYLKMFFHFPHLFEMGGNSLVDSPVNAVDFTTTSCAIKVCFPFKIICNY